MPEIVEVEIQREGLLRELIGERIADVEFYKKGEKVIRPTTTDEFRELVSDREILDVTRIGKYIIIKLSSEDLEHELYLASHLAMTGSWILDTEEGKEVATHKRLGLKLWSGRELYYNDTRIFGRIRAVVNFNDKIFIKGLDLLNSNESTLKSVILSTKEKSINIKKLLTNQDVICGLGNVYANEVLFRARIHPRRKTDELSDVELLKIAETIRTVLADGYKYRGLSMKDYFHVDGGRGKAQEHLFIYRKDTCTSCGNKVAKTKVYDKRSTYFCPNCQK